MSVIPAVFYLSTRLAGCSVGPRISRDTRKLTRTPRVIYIKKNISHLRDSNFFFNFNSILELQSKPFILTRNT